MAIDDELLKAELVKSRYDTDVRAGSNDVLVRMLHAEDPTASTTWDDIPMREFLDVIGDMALGVEAETRLLTIAENSGSVPTSKPGVQAWVESMIVDATIADPLKGIQKLDALKAIAERKKTYVEVSGAGSRATLTAVRRVVRTIAHSHIVATRQV